MSGPPLRLLGLVPALLALAGAGAARAGTRVPLAGTAPQALARMTDVGAVAGDTPLDLTVILGLRDRDALEGVIAAQQDRRSPRFRRWLDRSELADRFGARPAEYERVRRWFLAQGFAVVRDSPLRIGFVIRGTAAQAEAAFATPLRLFRHGSGTYRAPAGDVLLPDDIAPAVRGVLGLDDLPKFRPVAPVGVGQQALVPADFATVYDVTPLRAAGLTGAGRTIAVVARSNFKDSDVATFASRFLQPPRIDFARTFVDATRDPGILAAQGEEVEVLIDTQWAGALAPGATVDVIISPRGGDIPDSLQKAVADRDGDIISISFSLCEAEAPVAVAEYFDGLYALANAQGQTVLVASGDSGASECLTTRGGTAVNALASSPHAVAVGGTTFALKPDGAPGVVDETVWNDDYGASGGGESMRFARPSYQLAAGLLTITGGRALPDVALAASPRAPGYVIVQDGVTRIVGGTSASTPAFASVLALVNERLAKATGVSGLGQLLPSLYRLGSDQVRGIGGPVFRDVTVGNNAFQGNAGFPAGPGFDLATGWGAPLAAALADGVTAPGRCEPATDCLVPRPGPRSRACSAEWLVEQDVPALRAGVPGSVQVCRDGDPGCDVDGTVNGRCTMNVGLCVDVLDTRPGMLRTNGDPACPARSVRSVHILSPRPSKRDPYAAANRTALVGALAGLPDLPTALRSACTTTVPIVVPATVGSAGHPTRLRARVVDRSGTTGTRLELRCNAP